MWPIRVSSSTVRCWCLLLVLLSNHALWGQQLKEDASGGGPRPPPPVIKGCTPELRHFRRYRHFHHLCRTQPAVAVAAYEGLREAVQECQHQMRFHKWDCTQDHPTAPRDFTVLHEPSILRYGYRESAFLSALSAAGAAWGVATACAQGWLDVCQCDTQQHATQQSWEWGGCSYGVKFGVVTSRRLLRSRPKTKQRTHMRQMEKHNLKAGRLAVKKTLVKSCKCHGVSGSCQQKTCWKKATDLHTIGEHLTSRFARARLLVVYNSPNDSTASLNKVRSSELVYTEESPSFCEPNAQLRTVGTSGRMCNVRNATHTQGNCDRLCCGRGVSVRHEAVQYKCDCKFVWCCNVVCADCLKHHWVSTCK